MVPARSACRPSTMWFLVASAIRGFWGTLASNPADLATALFVCSATASGSSLQAASPVAHLYRKRVKPWDCRMRRQSACTYFGLTALLKGATPKSSKGTWRMPRE